jgi:tRNA threonylcarbamoyladenosine biosynthesis protein TsaE
VNDLIAVTENAEETRLFGLRMGTLLQPGDVVCLSGDLGAGKTTLTQGVAVGLGLDPSVAVNSPTFTIVAEHPGGRVPLLHFDVYRLSGPDDLYDLGFDDYLAQDGVVVIEWAEKIAPALPEDRLDIALGILPSDRRQLTLTAGGARSRALIDALNQP